VKKASDYRKHATECVRLARHADSAEHRDMLLKMAETWNSLAEFREQQHDLEAKAVLTPS